MKKWLVSVLRDWPLLLIMAAIAVAPGIINGGPGA